jgi:hypothetical protein
VTSGSGFMAPAGTVHGTLGEGGAAGTPFTRGGPISQPHKLNIDAQMVL